MGDWIKMSEKEYLITCDRTKHTIFVIKNEETGIVKKIDCPNYTAPIYQMTCNKKLFLGMMQTNCIQERRRYHEVRSPEKQNKYSG